MLTGTQGGRGYIAMRMGSISQSGSKGHNVPQLNTSSYRYNIKYIIQSVKDNGVSYRTRKYIV